MEWTRPAKGTRTSCKGNEHHLQEKGIMQHQCATTMSYTDGHEHPNDKTTGFAKAKEHEHPDGRTRTAALLAALAPVLPPLSRSFRRHSRCRGRRKCYKGPPPPTLSKSTDKENENKQRQKKGRAQTDSSRIEMSTSDSGI